MSFTATAHSINGTLRHEIDVNGRHTIITDEPLEIGGTDAAPAPHELLAAMLASCVSTMIALYAQRRDWQLVDVRVDVTATDTQLPRARNRTAAAGCARGPCKSRIEVRPVAAPTGVKAG